MKMRCLPLIYPFFINTAPEGEIIISLILNMNQNFIKKAANEILICQKILAFAFIPLKNIHHQGKQ